MLHVAAEYYIVAQRAIYNKFPRINSTLYILNIEQTRVIVASYKYVMHLNVI